MKRSFLFTITCLLVLVPSAQAATVWQVGIDDNGWPVDGVGGGPAADFVVERSTNSNPLPGDPLSPSIDYRADDDYYFAGLYSTVLDGSGYTPLGNVTNDEIAAERAFSGVDNSLRYHFNLPGVFDPTNLLSVTFDANYLHREGFDPRYGVEIWVNGIQVMSEVIIRPADIDVEITSPEFTLADVNGQVGPGFDNYVELRGINYDDDGGGNWMGVDFVQLNSSPGPKSGVPEPSYLGGIIAMVVLGIWYRRRIL